MTLIIPQKISLKWNATIKKRYVELGYTFTKMGEIFEVNIEDLQQGSNARIRFKCDYCGEDSETQYNAYNKSLKKTLIKKDSCKDCSSIKKSESNLVKYGVKSYFGTKEAREKSKSTMMDRYGFENPMQVKEFKEKQEETFIKNYGVSNPMLLEATKDKIKITNLERYGTEFSSQNSKVKEKVLSTHITRYGGMGMGSKEISEKISNTLFNTYGVKTSLEIDGVTEKRKEALKSMSREPISKQQYYIQSIIGGDFNYPLGRYLLDIAFPDEKIAIEYDGGGHDLSVKMGKITTEQFSEREKKRALFLKKNGWKTIRVISYSDKLPERNGLKEILIKAIDEIKSTSYLTTIKFNIEKREGLSLYKVSV